MFGPKWGSIHPNISKHLHPVFPFLALLVELVRTSVSLSAAQGNGLAGLETNAKSTFIRSHVHDSPHHLGCVVMILPSSKNNIDMLNISNTPREDMIYKRSISNVQNLNGGFRWTVSQCRAGKILQKCILNQQATQQFGLRLQLDPQKKMQQRIPI